MNAPSSHRFAMQDNSDPALLPLAGYPVRTTSAAELSALLQRRLLLARKTVLVFANTNFVMKCQGMRTWLCRDELIVVNDGIGMDIAALLKHGQRFRENLNGTDFVPYLLKDLRIPRTLFLLGGKPGVASDASTVMERDFGIKVVGIQDGYTAIAPEKLRAAINRSGADVVLVALGNPMQEVWVQHNMASLDANLFISVGALFDFLSGGVSRAPMWIRDLRLEWLYRLWQEPERMARRYTVDIARFLVLCIRYPRRKIGSLNPEKLPL